MFLNKFAMSAKSASSIVFSNDSKIWICWHTPNYKGIWSQKRTCWVLYLSFLEKPWKPPIQDGEKNGACCTENTSSAASHCTEPHDPESGWNLTCVFRDLFGDFGDFEDFQSGAPWPQGHRIPGPRYLTSNISILRGSNNRNHGNKMALDAAENRVNGSGLIDYSWLIMLNNGQ